MPLIRATIFVLISTLFMSGAAHAYVGPGAGAGAFAILLGILAAIGMFFVSVFWYPLKRMLKKKN